MIQKAIREAVFFEEEELSLEGMALGNFDNEEIRVLLEEAVDKSVRVLVLNNCKIDSLRNFPAMPKLSRLELADNQFAPSELDNLMGCLTLMSLNLSGTRISSVSELRVLRKLKRLVQLELRATKLAEAADLRSLVLEHFPQLKYLNDEDLQPDSKSLIDELRIRTY